MDRRDFIKTAVGIAAVAGAKSAPAQSAAPHPITVVGTSPDNTTQGGVVTPTGPVTAKLAQNPAMKYRPFGNTKIDGRTEKAAQQQIDESLKRLKTDHLDLLQFHEIIRPEDPETVFAPGAALSVALRAREQGKLRYIGFTGHKSPAIHAHMFEVADAHGFHFDSVQMPLNVMDAHYDSFEQRVLPIALARHTAVFGMKTFGDAFILESQVLTPSDLLAYSLSLPTTLQVLGIDTPAVLKQSLDAVASYQPLTPARRAEILAKSAARAADGSTERYKVSHHFDGTIQNPEWLG